jgi:hypothetical protein
MEEGKFNFKVNLYIRIVALIYPRNRTESLNEAIIKTGYSWVNKRYYKANYCSEWFEMEREARSKGCGGKMADAVMKALPEDWNGLVVMDWSRGFWDKMKEKYNNLYIL